MKKARLFKVVGFCLLIVIVLLSLQFVLQDKWFYDSAIYPRIRMLYKEKSQPDVVVIGSSHACWHINPLVMFHEYGISSCDFAPCGQSAELTRYYVDEAIKEFKPKIIVVEVMHLIDLLNSQGYSEGRSRQWLDPTDLSIEKIKTAYDLKNNQKTYGRSVQYDSLLSYAFPILRYHDRWKQLAIDDFSINSNSHYKRIMHYHGYDPYYQSVEANFNNYNNAVLYDSVLLQKAEMYFQSIVDICEKNNVELLMLKTVSPAWRKDKHDLIVTWADKYNVNFVDCNDHIDEIGMDLSQDFLNVADHLNDSGATKVSSYIGQYLSTNYDLPDHRGDPAYADWDYDWQVYQQDKASYFLAHEENFIEYIKKLQNPNYTIFLAAKDSISGNIYPEMIAPLENMGLSNKLKESYRQGYIAVIDGGNVIYERLEDSPLTYETDINGHNVVIESESWNLGNRASIRLDHKEMFVDHRGLGIVVYDNILNDVVDRVTWDIHGGGKAYR